MAKLSLLSARLQAGFERQKDLATAAKLGKSTVWLGENNEVISKKSAEKIVLALQAKGLSVSVEEIDWKVGSGKKKKSA